MKEAILIYLAIGVLLSIIGPLAREFTKEIKQIEREAIFDEFFKKEPTPSWIIVLLKVITRASSIVFYPIFYLMIAIDYVRIKSANKMVEPLSEEDRLLYYSGMGGAGTIRCNCCDFSQEIVSFLHSFGDDPWNKAGFQCQECGKFQAIERDMDNSQGRKCECGGKLKRKKPLFCPKCKTNSVSYVMSYIT